MYNGSDEWDDENAWMKHTMVWKKEYVRQLSSHLSVALMAFCMSTQALSNFSVTSAVSWPKLWFEAALFFFFECLPIT